MTYTVSESALKQLINEEVSRAAASAYSEDGASLYDSVVIRSRDSSTVSRMIRDSVDSVVRRTADICTVIPSPLALSFYVPDMDSTKESAAADELDRAISLGACALWFSEKLPSRSEEYTSRANAALDNAVYLMKTRIKPTRS